MIFSCRAVLRWRITEEILVQLAELRAYAVRGIGLAGSGWRRVRQ